MQPVLDSCSICPIIGSGCGASVAMRTTLDGASALPTLAPVPAPLSRTWAPCCSYWGPGMNL